MSDTTKNLQPWNIQRQCNPDFDARIITLGNIDRSEKTFLRNFVLFDDLNIPPATEEQGIVDWQFALLNEYCQIWNPTGYGLGDLVYTMSLLPGEELTLEVKTWQTDRRIEKDGTTIEERNLSDIQSTNSNSSEANSSVNTKEHIGVDAKAGYSGFGFSASVHTNWSEDVATSHSDNVKNARKRIDQATNELKATRKVQMEISRETGSESKTTRRIKNINQTHTLNAVFFQILAEYEISVTLNDVSLLLFGPIEYLSNPASIQIYNPNVGRYEYYKGGASLSNWYKNENGALVIDPNNSLSWGELFRNSRDINWSKDFQTIYGFHPNEVIRRAWVSNLHRYSPQPIRNMQGVGDYRKSFVDKMLGFVRPSDNWVEPGPNGELRWVYQIVPKHLRELFDFLQQESQKELPFEQLLEQFPAALESVGRVINADGKESYKVTTPTPGIYSDVSIGKCSGGEDYYEIQRQLDVKIKNQTLEKLEKENEQLDLKNKLIKDGKLIPEACKPVPDVEV